MKMKNSDDKDTLTRKIRGRTGETTTEEGHKVFFSEKEDKHEHGVFLVDKDIVNTVKRCLQQAPPEGSPFQHHDSKSVCPIVRL